MCVCAQSKLKMTMLLYAMHRLGLAWMVLFVVVVAIDIVNNGSSKLAHVMASVTIAQQGSSNQHVSDLLVN